MKQETLTQIKAPYWYVNGSHHNGRSYSTKQKGLGTKCAWCATHGEHKEATDHFIVGDHQVDLCNWCFNQAKSSLLHLKIKAGTVWGSEVKTSSDKHTDYRFVTDNPDSAQRVGTCEFCGHKFPHEGKHKKFCSPQCSRWYHVRLDGGDETDYFDKAKTGNCEICGAEFIYYSNKRKTCSNECRKILMRREYEANPKYITSVCLSCGKEFQAKVAMNGLYKRICSDKCDKERAKYRKRSSWRKEKYDMEQLAKALLGQP